MNPFEDLSPDVDWLSVPPMDWWSLAHSTLSDALIVFQSEILQSSRCIAAHLGAEHLVEDLWIDDEIGSIIHRQLLKTEVD